MASGFGNRESDHDLEALFHLGERGFLICKRLQVKYSIGDESSACTLGKEKENGPEACVSTF